MKTSGYSSTPLAKKLGIKENFKVKLINPPDYYFSLFDDLPKGITITKTKKEIDFIHYFSKTLALLIKDIPGLKNQIKSNGIIWISWYKKSSKLTSDVTEDHIREIALKNGLVDIKVCAVDEIWSGLKLVIPVKKRSTASNIQKKLL